MGSSSVEFTAPKPGATDKAVFALLVTAMAVYVYLSVKNHTKYKKIMAQYRKAGMGSIPADVQDNLSNLSGLDPMALGTWVTICFGIMCAVMMTMI